MSTASNILPEELTAEKLEAREKEIRAVSLKMGEKIGRQIGENRVNSLILKLSALGRTEDIVKAASDSAYENTLFQEFNL